MRQQSLTRHLLGLVLTAASLSATDLTGIWTGQVAGRNGEMEDISFRFKMTGDKLTGTMFGDEFDLPVQEGSVTVDQIKFTITTTNYYSGNQMKFQYTGKINGNQIELSRERVGAPPAENNNPNRQNFKRTFTIKRLT